MYGWSSSTSSSECCGDGGVRAVGEGPTVDQDMSHQVSGGSVGEAPESDDRLQSLVLF